MSWDPLQREVLEAMGLPLYRAVGATPAAVAPAQVAGTAPAGHPAIDAADPLVMALLRAAGRTPTSPDAPHIAATWPPLAMLRRDPRAKRALWPALRRWRRVPA